MKIRKRIALACLSLLLLYLILGGDISALFDFRLALLVFVGAAVFYFPVFREKKALCWDILGDCALYASMIQTFLLLFLLLSDRERGIISYGELARCSKPLFYGFFLWCILSGEKQSLKNKPEMLRETEMSAKEKYLFFSELGLSRREAEIATLASQDFSNGEIAYELSISEATVKKHMSHIFAKLGIERRGELRRMLASENNRG